MSIIIAVSIAFGFALGLFWRDMAKKFRIWVKKNIVDDYPFKGDM